EGPIADCLSKLRACNVCYNVAKIIHINAFSPENIFIHKTFKALSAVIVINRTRYITEISVPKQMQRGGRKKIFQKKVIFCIILIIELINRFAESRINERKKTSVCADDQLLTVACKQIPGIVCAASALNAPVNKKFERYEM